MGFVGVKLGSEYPEIRQCGASHALRVLTAINLVNFADRYVPAAVKTLFQDDLHLSDVQTTFPNTGMIIVYMIFAVFFGTIHDKKLFDRRYILCGAIIFWSAATALAGLSTNLVQLIALRSLVGVGEAAYGTIAPPMLSDFFQEHERNVVYAVYYLAIPVGAALGYGIGAVLGGVYGWREAFYGIGIPGLFVALAVLSINDPTYGINDPKLVTASGEEASKAAATEGGERSWSEWAVEAKAQTRVWLKDCEEVMTNKPFLVALAGQVANNFALGGLADWVSTFMIRYDGASVTSAGLIAGAATIVGGIVGNILGAKVADYYRPKVKNAYFLVPALFTIPATVLILLVVNVTNSLSAVIIFLFLGNILVWTYTGPISAIAISVIPPRLRARSAGLLIFFQHILGDIISPPIIGAISDSTGSLQRGMQLTWIFLGVSGVIYWGGYQFLAPLETYELQASGDVGSPSSSHGNGSGTGTASPFPFSNSNGKGSLSASAIASGGGAADTEVEIANANRGSDDKDKEQQAEWSRDQIPVGSDSDTPGPALPAPTYFELIFGNTDPLVLKNGVPTIKG